MYWSILFITSALHCFLWIRSSLVSYSFTMKDNQRKKIHLAFVYPKHLYFAFILEE